jgi:Ni/Fe-hydrogenase subunit HybB-like protein
MVMMMTNENNQNPGSGTSARMLFIVLFIIGLGAFVFGLFSKHPERAWQAYLINFLLFSAIAQGALTFSAIMRVANARWSGPLSGLAESFAAFFPLSFVLFLILFFGRTYLFPWLHEDLHGKEIWLNIPFLFTRNAIGLIVLYGLGFLYLYYSMALKLDPGQVQGRLRGFISGRLSNSNLDAQRIKRRLVITAGWYLFTFVMVMSLIGYDLVMSMDPHWISTLFAPYIFVKAIYVGLGGLIIFAAIYALNKGPDSPVTESHFHDIGKLFFAFCLLWADFFYVQLLVIYYGNIPEETYYVIARTVMMPWRPLAIFIFAICFIIPFVILINKKVKTQPVLMIILCSAVIIGIWFEHLLLLGPALSHHATELPVGITDVLISLGFLGLLAFAVSNFIRIFPEMVATG